MIVDLDGRAAALAKERFRSIPPHRILPADQPHGCRFRRQPLTAGEEYERAVALGVQMGDTPAVYASRLAFLADLGFAEHERDRTDLIRKLADPVSAEVA